MWYYTYYIVYFIIWAYTVYTVECGEITEIAGVLYGGRDGERPGVYAHNVYIIIIIMCIARHAHNRTGFILYTFSVLKIIRIAATGQHRACNSDNSDDKRHERIQKKKYTHTHTIIINK